MEPTVRNFVASLKSFLTQYDVQLSKRGRMPNIHRLGHFLGAADEVEKDVEERLDSSDPADLAELSHSIMQHFEDFPPRRKILKQIEEYLATGRPPSYGGAKKARGGRAKKLKKLGTLIVHPETAVLYWSPHWWNDPSTAIRRAGPPASISRSDMTGSSKRSSPTAVFRRVPASG